MAKLVLLISGILILATLIAFLLTTGFQIGVSKKMEYVSLTSPDGIQIAGDYYRAKGERGVVLLHMMPRTKESWRELALRLQAAGWDVLAIDLRGHGKSDGGPRGYLAFSDEAHQKSILDVETGVAFLESKGIDRSRIALAGASIGANLALWYAADHPEIQQIVLLSPGLNYRGIEAEPLARKLRANQRVFFASSKDDTQSGGNNAEMNQRLFELVADGVEKKLVLYTAAGHGTDMLGKEKPYLAEEIVNWLK